MEKILNHDAFWRSNHIDGIGMNAWSFAVNA